MTTQPIDPCAEATRLREIRTLIVTGRSESQIRFDVEEVRYHKADLSALDRLISEYDRACAIRNGETPKRTRFAKRAAFRPY